MRLYVLLGQPFSGDRLLHRQVVGVADPADGVGVLAVAGGKLCRTPAGDRLSHELLRGDERAEADEDDDERFLTCHLHIRYTCRVPELGKDEDYPTGKYKYFDLKCSSAVQLPKSC